MAAIKWPENLPVTFKLEGLQGQYQDPVIRTEMDAGPKKARLRYTAVSKKYTGVITITAPQRQSLEAFYQVTTKYGALRFTMTDPMDLTEREYRFTAPPAESAHDGLYDVTIQLERM